MLLAPPSSPSSTTRRSSERILLSLTYGLVFFSLGQVQVAARFASCPSHLEQPWDTPTANGILRFLPRLETESPTNLSLTPLSRSPCSASHCWHLILPPGSPLHTSGLSLLRILNERTSWGVRRLNFHGTGIALPFGTLTHLSFFDIFFLSAFPTSTPKPLHFLLSSEILTRRPPTIVLTSSTVPFRCIFSCNAGALFCPLTRADPLSSALLCVILLPLDLRES